MRTSVKFACAALAAATAAAAPLAAQTVQPVVAHAPRQQALTIQPISIIVGFYSAEYERAISRSTTLGIGAGYLDGIVGNDDPTDPTYVSVDAKLRYYPGEQPLRGFSFGVTGGYSAATSHTCDYDLSFNCISRTSSTAGGPAFGFQLDYNWLLGRNQNFVVALGAGAKRLFVKKPNDDLTVAYPTARISVGLAF